MPNVTPKDAGLDLTTEHIKERNALINRFIPLVHKTAISANRTDETHYTLDDLISCGYESLTTTATKHIREGSLTAKFASRATTALKGDMQKFKEREASMFSFDDYTPIDNDWKDVAETTEHDTPETKLSKAQDRDRVKVLLTELDPITATVINLVFFMDYTQVEAGEAMGLSQQDVGRLIDKGLVTLRQHM